MLGAKRCRNHPLPVRIEVAAVQTEARSSVGLERFLDTEEVDGSNPFGPTILCNWFERDNLPRIFCPCRSLVL
jgi:hypothetical protein